MHAIKILGVGLAVLITCRLGILPVPGVTIPLSQIPVGKVVSVNGLKFVKITNNQYLATAPLGSMQGWNGCASLPNPACTVAGNCTTTTVTSQLFTQGPTLMDARDGQRYEIRKFPDGKCWMVDNLRYGGTTTANGNLDACNGKTTFAGDGQSTPYVSWYQGSAQLYGDCRDPHQGGSAPCNTNTASGVPQCGYYYNWQAAMQLSSAYQGSSTSYPFGMPTSTANFIQGICPDGWHIPSGGTNSSTSEWIALDMAVGGNGGNNQTGRSYTYFWRASNLYTVTVTDPWKNILSGWGTVDGLLRRHGSYGFWWPSTEVSATTVYYFAAGDDSGTQYIDYKNYGYSVRCIQN
jgi:uncharacterized protein (TIGR02145 family)